jgi:hypothetical protein
LESNCAMALRARRPASFPGAPVKPFYGAGDERIVVVHF